MGLSLLSAVFGLLAPYFQKEFIDQLTGAQSHYRLGWFDGGSPTPWIFLAFLCMLGAQASWQLCVYLGTREGLLLQKIFARRLYQKMLALKVDTLSRRALGEIVSLYATDVPGGTIFLDQTIPMGASTLFPLILAPFAITAFFGVPLWPTFGVICAITLVNTGLAFRQSKFFYRFKQLAAERIGLVNEWVQNIRTLRILGWVSSFETKIFAKRELETANRVSMVTNGQVMNAISTSVTFFLNLLTLAYLILWSDHKLTGGEILALLWILGVFLTRPFRQMPWFFTFFFDGLSSLRRVQEFIDTPNNASPPVPARAATASARSALHVDGLQLEINGHTLLHDVSLDITEGEFVAIVGEVGSGKSLLLLSLLGETGAAAADYRVLGREARRMDDAALKKSFAFVPQEGFIMSANLRDNVVFDYDSPASLDEKVLKSLKDAQFEPGRERTDNGLETEIGERGVNLSGGQRQRVSLARVHFDDAPILLLDDCLSAVDVDTEARLVRDLLKGEWKDKTRVLVTHRLTVLPLVDRIFFMKEGRLLDTGTFDELMRRCADFREFTSSLERKEKEANA